MSAVEILDGLLERIRVDVGRGVTEVEARVGDVALDVVRRCEGICGGDESLFGLVTDVVEVEARR